MISKKMTGKIVVYTDQGHIAALCYQKYTVLSSSLWGPGGYGHGAVVQRAAV